VAVFNLTAGTDNFTGNPGEYNVFNFTPSTLAATDTLTGGATGAFVDVLVLTAGGTVTAAQFAGVTNIEQLNLAAAGNSVTLTNGLVAGSSIAGPVFSVIAGAGVDNVNASGVTNGVRIAFRGSGGNDTFIGGTAADLFLFAPTDLTVGNTITGGLGIDTIQLLAGGVVAANAFTNVSGIEVLGLSHAGNTVTLTNALAAGDSTLQVYDGTGSDTVNGSGVTNGRSIHFWSQGGNDALTGGSSHDTFFFNPTDLTASDTLVGGAGYDAIQFTAAGTVAAADFTGVTGVDALVLNNAGNNVNLSNSLVGSNDQGGFAVVDGTGNDVVDGSGVTNGTLLAVYSNGGTDSFTGGTGNDFFGFNAGDLTSADTVVGGSGYDALFISSAGVVTAADAGGVSGIEALVLGAGNHVITLSDALTSGSSTSNFAVVDGASGDDTVDASAATGRIAFYGVAGADTYIGGAGADYFVMSNTSFANLSGNGGLDRLLFTSAFDNQTFNLTANSFKFSNVEIVSLANATNVTMSLVAADIPLVNATTNLLYIVGGSDDDVIVGDTWTVVSTTHTNAAVSGDTFVQYHNTTTNSDLFIANQIATTISTAVGEAPAVADFGGTLAYAEDDLPKVIDSSVTLTDVDSATLAFATVKLTTNYVNGQDILSFVNGGGINGSWDAVTGTLTLTPAGASATLAQFEAAIEAVRYNNTSPNPSTLDRTVEVQVNDGVTSSNIQTKTITVTAANDAPFLTTSGWVSVYTEDGAAAVVDAALTVTDPDDTNIESATVTISSGLQAGDALSFTSQFGITDSNADPAILALTGSATKAEWETVLRSVTFSTTNQDPTTSRTIRFVVNDGDASSTPVDKIITITPTADAPVVADFDGTLAYAEDELPKVIDSSVTLTDIDSGTLAFATVKLTTNYVNGEDILSFVNGGGINGSWDPLTGTLTLTPSGASATLAQFEAAIEAVRYNNTSPTPSTLDRTVEVQVNDGSASSNIQTKTITVTAVNDAPALATSGFAPSYTEDGTATAVDTGFTITDPDDTNIESASVTITGGLQSGDSLSFTSQFGITDSNADPAILTLTGSATKAEWETVLRSITFSTTNQTPTASRTISLTVNDGDANSNTVTKNITVVPVNDEPTLTATANGGGAVTFTETSLPTFPGSGPVDLFSSPDASTVEPGQTLSQVVLTVTNVADTTEFLTIGATVVDLVNGNSEAVTVGGAAGTASVSISGSTATITVTPTTAFTEAQVEALVDSLAYSNSDDTPTATTHTISVATLTDSGSNVAPNDNIGSTSVSTVVTVVPTNDAPVAADHTFNGSNSAIANTALRVTDGDGMDPADPAGPQKTISTGGGTLLTGATDPDGPVVLAVAETVATTGGGQATITVDGDFLYLPAAGFTGNDTFTYTLTDTAGGTDTGTVTINVAAPKVWYVDDSAAPGGDGTSDNPFNSLAALNGVTGDGTTNDDVDGANDIIFLYNGTYSGGIVLEDGQQLISQSQGLTVNGTVLEAATGSNALINGAVVLASGNTIDGVDIGNTGSSSVFALSGANVGNAVFTDGSINNTSGGAINISGTGTGMNLQFTSVSSTGSSTNAISFNEARGTFNAGSGTLSNAGGNTVTITGNGVNDDLGFTYGGALSDDGNLLVNITGQTGGTKDFNGALTDGSGAGGGISLVGNTGATMRFDGGMSLTTTTATAFNATGGGTVVVTDTASTSNILSTTTATALNVANTTIGAEDITFQSISAGTGTNSAGVGISLDNTGSSGGLHVTGTGTADSGGTIQHKGTAGTTNGINTDGVGIYLNNTDDVQLANMQLNDFANYAIRGNDVVGLTLNNLDITGVNGSEANGATQEYAVNLTAVTGNVNILNTEVSGGYLGNVRLDNQSGTTNLNFLNNNIHNTNAAFTGDGFNLEAELTATLVANISNNVFNDNDGDDFNLSLINSAVVDLTFNNNDLIGGPGKLSAGVFILGATFNGSLEYDISGNDVQGANQGGAIFVNKGSGTGTFSGQIVDNVIGNPSVPLSGAQQSVGIHASARGAGGSHTTLIHSNEVYEYFDRGIVLEAGEGSPTLVATVTENTVSDFGDAINSLHGIHFDFGILGTDNAQITIDVRNNLIANAANEPQGGADFRMRTAGSNDVFIAGYSGGNSSAAVQAFIDAQNPNGTSFSVSQAASGTYNNGPASPLPAPNLPELPPAPLLAADGGVEAAGAGTPGGVITGTVLATLADAAITRWAATGLSVDQLATLDGITITVADLGGDQLGHFDNGVLVIDDDAAGRGWFIDATPLDDIEFANMMSGTWLQTDPTAAPAGHFDLLTLIMHEIGHGLGLDDTYAAANHDELMYGQLAVGERRLPDVDDADSASHDRDPGAAVFTDHVHWADEEAPPMKGTAAYDAWLLHG